MPFNPPDDYWIHLPACTYTLGFTPEEAHRFAQLAADIANAQPLPEMDAWKELDDREKTTGNAGYIEQWVLTMALARTVEIPAYSVARAGRPPPCRSRCRSG